MSLKDTLRGTGVALVTPFTIEKEVDYPALGRLLEYVITNGADYLVTLGTTGETSTLTKDEKRRIIDYTFEKVNNRLPIVIGVGGNNTAEVINSLKSLPLVSATAILSASPYYNKPSQEGIYQHYKSLAEASPKPIILYNVPGRTGSNINASTTLRLSNEVKNICGIKEASGNMVQCMHIIKDAPKDFLLISGDDHLTLSLIACGMDGVISVAANCFPKKFCAMVKSALAGEYAMARLLHYECLEGNDLLFIENNPAGAKAFLARQKIIDNYLRLPLVPLDKAYDERVDRFHLNYIQ